MWRPPEAGIAETLHRIKDLAERIATTGSRQLSPPGGQVIYKRMENHRGTLVPSPD